MATKPPKLILPIADVPTRNPSVYEEIKPWASKDSVFIVFIFCPEPLIIDTARSLGLDVISPVGAKSPTDRTSWIDCEGWVYCLSDVIGANGLPCLLSGIGAGCMFSPPISSGWHQNVLNLPPWPIKNSGWYVVCPLLLSNHTQKLRPVAPGTVLWTTIEYPS